MFYIQSHVTRAIPVQFQSSFKTHLPLATAKRQFNKKKRKRRTERINHKIIIILQKKQKKQGRWTVNRRLENHSIIEKPGRPFCLVAETVSDEEERPITLKATAAARVDCDEFHSRISLFVQDAVRLPLRLRLQRPFWVYLLDCSEPRFNRLMATLEKTLLIRRWRPF